MSESTFIAWLLISAVVVEVVARVLDRREQRTAGGMGGIDAGGAL